MLQANIKRKIRHLLIPPTHEQVLQFQLEQVIFERDVFKEAFLRSITDVAIVHNKKANGSDTNV